jgi:hypothetical protein
VYSVSPEGPRDVKQSSQHPKPQQGASVQQFPNSAAQIPSSVAPMQQVWL